MRITPLLLALFAPLSIPAQVLYSPSSASTRLYFAQLADGGTSAQKWTTTLALVNPGNTAASVSLSFYADSGQPLALDFGQGSKATFTVSVPSGGTATYTSSGGSSTIVVGWALATSDVPVLGTVLYRASTAGVPTLDVSASGTGPTYFYESFATYDLGIALVNPSATQSINLLLTARDLSGNTNGTKAITLAPDAHLSTNLGTQVSGLSGSFAGSVTISSTDNPPTPFVAWTLNSRNNLLTSLPQGEMLSIPPHDRRAYDALARVKAAVVPLVQEAAQGANTFKKVTTDQVLQFFSPLSLSIDSDSTIKTSYQASDKTIHITQAALETLGGNDAALAFLIMRAAVMGFVNVYGVSPDIGLAGASNETSAQAWALIAMMKAGYDLAGGPDCLARIWSAYVAGVPVDSALVTAFSIPDGTGSLIKALSLASIGGCSAMPSDALAADCNAAHNLWHPHYPSKVP